MAIDAKEVKLMAEGRWLHIFSALAPALENAIARLGKHVPSPVRGGKDGFRLFKDSAIHGRSVCNQDGVFSDGFATLMHVTGLDFHSTVMEVWKFLGGDAVTPVTLPPRETAAPAQTGIKPEKLEWLWDRAGLSSETAHPAAAYLAGRGIDASLFAGQPALRFADQLMTGVDGKKVRFPGLLARVTDKDGEIISLHRTFLTPEGEKALGAESKKLMRLAEGKALAGASIKIGQPIDGILGIAEGIETALSATQLTGVPCWSVVNTFGMETFLPPEGVDTVVIFGDKDKNGAGLKSANALKQKLEEQGIKVLRIFPKETIPAGENSLDWNDVLVGGGRHPTLQIIRDFAR